MKKIASRTVSFILVAAMVLATMPVSTATATAPVRVDLTAAQTDRLVEFFRIFTGFFSLRNNYDAENPNRADAVLEFVLYHAIFVEWQGTYPFGGEKENFGHFAPEGEIGSTHFYVNASHIESLLLRLFDIVEVQHQDIGRFEYRNGRYYYPVANGGAINEITITAFYDNRNGTYSARIESRINRGGGFDAPEYHLAVIQPFTNTYQLLYWRNNVTANEPIPLRQPTISTIDIPADYTLRLTIGSMVYTHLGQTLQSDAAPFIEDGRTMVPLRLIAEGLDADVKFEESLRTVFIRQNGMEISIPIDMPLSEGLGTPTIIDGRTFVPLRYVSEVLGVDLRWDAAAGAVYIYR